MIQQSSGLSAAKQKGDHLCLNPAAQPTEIMISANFSLLFQVTLVVNCQQMDKGLFEMCRSWFVLSSYWM